MVGPDRLARAEDVVGAENAVVDAELLVGASSVVFAGQLGDARGVLGAAVIRFAMRRRDVAVDGRGAGEHQPLDAAGVDRRGDHVRRRLPDVVDRVRDSLTLVKLREVLRACWSNSGARSQRIGLRRLETRSLSCTV